MARQQEQGWPAPGRATPRTATACAERSNQLARVHDAERVERVLDRLQCMNPAGGREAGEFAPLQLADAVLGGDRAAGGRDEVVDHARDRFAFALIPVGRGMAAGAHVKVDVAVAEMAEAAGDHAWEG